MKKELLETVDSVEGKFEGDFERKFIASALDKPGAGGYKEDFGAFLQKKAAGENTFDAFAFSDRVAFFKGTEFYNPFREICSRYSVNNGVMSFKMPKLAAINYGAVGVAAGAPGAMKNEDYNRDLDIKLETFTAKLEVERNFFNRVNGYSEYIKNVLISQIYNSERALFSSIIERSATVVDKTAPAAGARYENHADDLIKVCFALKPQYRNKNSYWVMSSRVLNTLISKKDSQNRYIFNEHHQIFGYSVKVVEELEHNVLFGDFRQSVVIFDQEVQEIQCIPSYANPQNIGLSLSVYSGLGCVDLNGLVKIDFA